MLGDGLLFAFFDTWLSYFTFSFPLFSVDLWPFTQCGHCVFYVWGCGTLPHGQYLYFLFYFILFYFIYLFNFFINYFVFLFGVLPG